MRASSDHNSTNARRKRNDKGEEGDDDELTRSEIPGTDASRASRPSHRWN